MKDIFLTSVFEFSRQSAKTKKEYAKWITRLCTYSEKDHPLDIRPEDVKSFYLSLIDRDFSPASLTLVRSAIKYFYGILCEKEAPEIYRHPDSQKILDVFPGKVTHAYTLPVVASQRQMQAFLDSLPDTTAGNIIKEIYRTGDKFDAIINKFPFTISCSIQTCQQVAARAARKVGIPHGFGLRGVRASSFVHRLQKAESDMERVQIFKDSGLRWAQFKKYYHVAGISIDNISSVS